MSRKLEIVNQWLMLATNIGVIASLILVGFQIKQNSEIASAQLAAGAFEAGMQMETTVFGEDPALVLAKLHGDPSALTDEDLIVIYHWVHWYFDLSSRFEVLHQQGLVPDGEWNTHYRAQARNVYGLNDVTQAAWKRIRNDYQDYEWIRVVEAELTRMQAEGNNQPTWLEAIQEGRASEQQKRAPSQN